MIRREAVFENIQNTAFSFIYIYNTNKAQQR